VWMVSGIALCAVVPAAFAQPDLVLYAPLDGSPEPLLGASGVRVESAGDLSFAAGLLGQALDLKADCRYDVGQAFPMSDGTFAIWVKPHWAPGDQSPHYLMCIYGNPTAPEPWCHDRWTVAAQGGTMNFTLYPHGGGQPHAASAPIAGWQPGTWHHVAATWRNLNSGADNAALRLFIDGKLAAEVTGLRVDVRQPSSRLDVGRDSDASPDYGEALFDDVFLYARALTAEEISAAVARIQASDVHGPPRPPSAPRNVPGWVDPTRPYRVAIETPPVERDRTDASIEIPLDFGRDLRQLGVAADVDPSTLRLVETALAGGKLVGADIPLNVEDGRVSWVASGPTPANAQRRSELYFDALPYQHIAPLLVVRQQPRGEPPRNPDAAPTDYATVTWGDPWDFDDGDTEHIDAFGNKPAYFRDIRVVDGALTASVSQDPYFIWGSMWGPEDKGQRQVRLDVDEYSILAMRLRQSVPVARWAIFGRVLGTDRLLTHKFTVSGQSWQKVRIDLVNEARWGGVLSAFRIDPTEEVDAHTAIDWVRLLAVQTAQRAPIETLGSPSGVPASVTVSLADAEPQVGQEQPLAVVVADQAGRPVAQQPVTLRLKQRSGGELRPLAHPLLPVDSGWRGLTDGEGSIVLSYRASHRAAAAADTILAAAECPALDAKPLSVATRPGPPDHYLVHSDQVTILREADAPFPLKAQVVDAFGNALPVAGRKLTWTADDGRFDSASPATDATGSAAAVFRPDPSHRWVYAVRVRDEQGLSGGSGPVCVLPKGPRSNPVRLLKNGYFATADGKPYLPLGGFYINWVGLPDPRTGEEGRIIRSFTDATEEQTLHWLDYLHRQGVTTLRFMLRTHTPRGLEPMDIGGRVNRPLLARALRLMDLARRFDIRLLLVIHDDYDKPVYCNRDNLRTFSLPLFAGEDLGALPPYQRRFIRDGKVLRQAHDRYTDPDAIACQDDYGRELVGYLRDNPQVFGYELENEMVDCPAEWATHAIGAIRSVDPMTPICVSHGGGGLDTADPLWWTASTPIDFYTYHLYPLGTTSEEIDYGLGVSLLARYGRMAGTCFLGESSGDEFSLYPPERDAERRYIMRDIIWMSLIEGNPGCFFWNARGYELEEFRLAHEIMSRVDWATWQRERPPTAVVVSHPLVDDKYYRSPQGAADRAMMARYSRHYLAAGVDFDFATSPQGYAHTATLAEFAPPDPPARPFGISPGFELSPLTRQGFAEGLLYIRNVAGTRPWQVPQNGTMWLRDRKPAPLRVALDLPLGKLTLTHWDLDTGASETRTLAGKSALDLGVTDHDFAIHWRKAP